jgi:hypothetical protein
MTMHNLSRLGLCLALAAGVSACSQQSTYHRQDLALAPSWQQPDDGLTRQQAGLWWQGFHDPALDQLVEAVLAANPDMPESEIVGRRFVADITEAKALEALMRAKVLALKAERLEAQLP